MNRFKEFFTSRTAGPFLIVIALVLFGAFFLVMSDSPGDAGGGGVSLSAVVALTVIIILLAYGVLATLLQLGGADHDSPELAREIAPGEPAAQALLERWLRRSRYYRFVGGLLGLLLGFPFGDAVFVTLVGITVGGALAEIHVFRRRGRSAKVADLTVRRLRDYVNTADVVAMVLLAGGAIVVLIARLFGHGIKYSMRWAIITLAVLAAVVGMQYLVATRSRPALSNELRGADDLLRFLASTQGFARPAIALSFFMLAIAVANDESAEALRFISGALMVLGLVWWYRGRHGRIPKLAHRARTA